MQILCSVVGWLKTPQDLFSCILTSQQLRAAVRSGHMRLELKGRPRQLLTFPAQARQLDDLVQSLTRYMPGVCCTTACSNGALQVWEVNTSWSLTRPVLCCAACPAAMSTCDLSMLPLEHRHVSKLSQGLHLLQHLDLSGCKKLQPSMTQQLLMGLASKQLRSLNLQRCFQLTDTCLTDILEYACGSHSSSKALQCIALSHLDLAAWPAGAAAATAASADGMQSQDLDNNNSNSNKSSSSDGETDTATPSNDVAGVAAAGSTAVQWGAFADRLLHKLPKQLCARLPADGSTAALRVVVLNNCSALSVGGLVAMAGACPLLEYLFLGGSTLKLPVSGAQAAAVYVPRSVAAAAAAGPAGEASTTGSDVELPPALQQLSDLLQLPQTLPWEALSSCCDADCCGGSSGCGQAACSCTCGCCSSAQQRGRAGSDAGGGGAEEHERARKRLHRNEPSAAAVATARGHALWLAYVAALLPGLKAVEVTFIVPGLAGWLRVCLNRLQQVRQHHTATSPNNSLFRSSSMGSPEGNARPKVWQFSCAAAVADASATLSQARRAHRAAGGSTTSSGGSVKGAALLDPDCLSLGVRCAVNCSSRGRSTPLHMAADAGCACHVRGLVAAGAAVAARDASGASALFVACESGQAAAAAVLLGAGADALVGNTAGETPLYIAALRGHLSVVQLLLQHLSAVQVDWTQRQLYGDAWTPLMAAAVANRVSRQSVLCGFTLRSRPCLSGQQSLRFAVLACDADVALTRLCVS